MSKKILFTILILASLTTLAATVYSDSNTSARQTAIENSGSESSSELTMYRILGLEPPAWLMLKTPECSPLNTPGCTYFWDETDQCCLAISPSMGTLCPNNCRF